MNNVYLKNRELNRLEQAQGKIILESKPRRLQIVLTGRCNLQCIMCERKMILQQRFDLAKNYIKQIIDYFPYLDIISWQGGEVFLVDYFEELFCEASMYPNLFQEINTNGLLINEKWADLIAKSGTRLILSIDSTKKDIYEYIRKGAKFDSLIKGIELIREDRKRYNRFEPINIINVVVMHSNYTELEAFVDFALKYNFGSLNFMHMIGNLCPRENIFNPPDSLALDYLRETMPKIKQKGESYGLNVVCEFEPFLSDDNPIVLDRKSAGEKKFHPSLCSLFCRMPWSSLFIDIGGIVYPECLCQKALGNIMEDSLVEMWNNKNMQMYRRKIIEQDQKRWCNPDCLKGLVNKEFLQNR